MIPFHEPETLEAELANMARPYAVCAAEGGDRRALFAAAAKGDHKAQAAMVCEFLADAADGSITYREAIQHCETFAELAAVSGVPGHHRMLAVVLLMRAVHAREAHLFDAMTGFQARALFHLEQAAKADPQDNFDLVAFAASLTPEAVAMAARLERA